MEIIERIRVTAALVEDFARISGDDNPIHLDEEAAKASIFGRRIAHGILLASFFSKLIAKRYPGPGSIYLSQSLEFMAPCFVDDEIDVKLSLIEQNGKVYLLDTIITDVSGKLLVKGQAKVLKK